MLSLRNLLFVLLGILISIRGNAIDLNNTDSVNLYYQYIHIAESAILKNDFTSSVTNYDTAFRYKKYPFAQDIYNCLCSYVLLNDNKNTLRMACLLVKKGAPLTFFTKQSFFKKFIHSKEGKDLTSQYGKIHGEFLTNVDSSIINRVKWLIAIDQSVHCMLPTMHKDTAFVRQMREDDDSLSTILINLLQTNDFLSEEIVGANFINDTILDVEPLYGTLVLHQIQKNSILLSSILDKMMVSGYIKSDVLISWLSRTTSVLNISKNYTIFADTLWMQKETEQEWNLYLTVLGESKDSYTQKLHHYYIDDSNYNVKSRVIYNYYKQCKECSSKKKLNPFLILPVCLKFDSIDKQSLQYFYDSNTPLAFP